MSHQEDMSEDTQYALHSSIVDYDPFSRESVGSKRSIMQRMVSKLEPTSLRGGVITLISGALGLGVFSYPKAFSFYGYIAGTIAIIYAGLTSMYSYYLMSYICALYPNHSLYSQMVQHFLGSKWGRYTSWIFIFYYTGCCIGYIIVSN